MIYFTAIFDFFLYLAFAFTAGAIVLQFVPESKKPQIRFSRGAMLFCVAGIVVFSAAPVIELADFLLATRGPAEALTAVLIDYRTGQGWLLTLLFSIILGFAVYFKASRYVQAFYALLLVLTVGFYSHVSTLDLWAGFFSHSVHFLAIVLWAGVLLHVAWLSDKAADWPAFLKWFTPFALICMAAIIASGVIIMFFFVAPADYANSWVLPYGQSLLLKHLTIIPLLLAALINGFLNRRKLYDKAWLRMESVLLLLVLAFTALMSKQAPPHDVNDTLRMEGTAPLLKLLKGDQFIPLAAAPDWTLNGVLLLAMAALLLIMIIIAYYKKLSAWLPALFGIGFVICAYIGIMLNFAF